jgi:hypothetical protein
MCDDGIDEAQRAGEIAGQRSGSDDVAQGDIVLLDLAEFGADTKAVDQVAIGGFDADDSGAEVARSLTP